jgi:nucleoside-diphosphate-sugar epimerase
MRKLLITGGSGFFGEVLLRRLLADGHACVNIDLQADPTRHPNLVSVQGDIRDAALLERLFAEHRFDGVVHAAAMLAHAIKDPNELWTSNVDGTARLCEAARNHGAKNFVFVSTNCLWADDFGRPVTEEDVPAPIEVYGRSKAEAERVLLSFKDSFHAVAIRTPTIIDAGRLGLLAILFSFIREGRKVWVVGKGSNRYQFVYAPDLADACARALDYPGSDVFNVGSDNVRPLREVYEHVIREAGTASRVASLPEGPTLLAMRLLYGLGLSPLGPYHYRMISKNFLFDTSKIKAKLGWRPTLTNEEILARAYRYYAEHHDEISRRSDVSAHKQSAKMGLINLLKWVS